MHLKISCLIAYHLHGPFLSIKKHRRAGYPVMFGIRKTEWIVGTQSGDEGAAKVWERDWEGTLDHPPDMCRQNTPYKTYISG